MANDTEKMSASELKYLLAIRELSAGSAKTNLTAIADKMFVSKASVSHALERLETKGYLKRDKKHISVSEKGICALEEYNVIIGFISKHLELHCKVSPQIALNDAIAVTCVFSENSRRGVAEFVQKTGEKCDGKRKGN